MQTDVHLCVITHRTRRTARLACIPWTLDPVALIYRCFVLCVVIAHALCVVNQRVFSADVLAVKNAFFEVVILKIDSVLDVAWSKRRNPDAFVLVVHIHNSLDDFDTRDVAWLRLAPAVFRKCVHKRVVILPDLVDVPAIGYAPAVVSHLVFSELAGRCDCSDHILLRKRIAAERV